MEPAGLAVGVFGLAGLFGTCMQSFEYIEYGRNFGADYQTAAIKLEVTRLRLSRWAASIGLNDDPAQQRTLENQLSSVDVDTAKDLLGNIIYKFDIIERASKRYETTHGKVNASVSHAQEADPSLIDGSSDDVNQVRMRLAKMHSNAKNKILSRQKFTRTRDKARWALYERRRFDDLIREIIAQTNDLVEVFPAAQTAHRRMAAEEVQEIAKDADDRLLLKGVAGDTDPILHQAVEQEIQAQDGLLFERVKVAGYSRAFLGNDVAHGVRVKGSTYRDMVIEGNAYVHAGNIYRAEGQRQVKMDPNILKIVETMTKVGLNVHGTDEQDCSTVIA